MKSVLWTALLIGSCGQGQTSGSLEIPQSDDEEKVRIQAFLEPGGK